MLLDSQSNTVVVLDTQIYYNCNKTTMFGFFWEPLSSALIQGFCEKAENVNCGFEHAWMIERVLLKKSVGNILIHWTLSSFKWMCGILFILLWVIKGEVDNDFRPVPAQEFKAVVFCVNPLREGNDHQSQVFGARLSKVGIKPTSPICESLGLFQWR